MNAPLEQSVTIPRSRSVCTLQLIKSSVTMYADPWYSSQRSLPWTGVVVTVVVAVVVGLEVAVDVTVDVIVVVGVVIWQPVNRPVWYASIASLSTLIAALHPELSWM